MQKISAFFRRLYSFFSVPAHFTRLIISLFIFSAFICFLFPLVTISPNPDNLVGSFLQGRFKGIKMNGIQLILAPFSDKTIHEFIDIGPLPCNPYIVIAAFCGLVSVVLLWLGVKHRRCNLFSGLLSLVSAVAMIFFRPRFAPFYSTYTKNGGDLVQHYYDSGFFDIIVTPALVLSAIFFFFAFMATIMLGEMLARPFSYSELQD